MKIAELIQLQTEESKINYHNETMTDFLNQLLTHQEAPGVEGVS